MHNMSSNNNVYNAQDHTDHIEYTQNYCATVLLGEGFFLQAHLVWDGSAV